MTFAPTVGCLFSGMGGFATGLAEAGFKLLWANDADASACATFQHRFPKVRVLEKDVRRLSVKGDRLAEVDVLIAGFPCQSFSQAGDRRGFDDPRGELFLEIPRLLSEFSTSRKPDLVVLENVPNLLYGADGSWFQRIRRSLRQSGYWFRRESCWETNVRHATDLPQDRARLFMVAASRSRFRCNPFKPSLIENQDHQGSLTISDIVDRNKRASESEYLSPRSKYHQMIQDAITNGQSEKNIFQLRRSYVREKQDQLCPTLTANMGEGGHNVPFVLDKWGIRRLRISEVAQLQGFDDFDSLFPSLHPNVQYRLLGNAVCVKLATVIGHTCFQILKEERSQ